MAITGLDALVNAMANNRQKLPVTKTANVTSQVAGGTTSLWRVAGFPPAGITASGACSNATTGAVPFVNPSDGLRTHLTKAAIVAATAMSYELHDRLVHSAAMSGAVTSAQTGVDLHALLSTSNLAERRGRADYLAVQWWLEWATATGTTAVTATVDVRDTDGAAYQIAVAVPASTAGGRMLPIVPPAGRAIRAVDAVTLSASTGTAGAFNVVATLQRTELASVVPNQQAVLDWSALGLPVIYDSSCLFLIAIANTTSVSAPSGALTFAQG